MAADTRTARALARPPQHGDSSVLRVEDVDVPPPGRGEVQVEVAAVGVNFIDVYQRQGVYPLPTPFVSCSEGAGTVVAVGPGVDDVAVGDRVAWGQGLGAAATVVNRAADVLVPVPDGLDLDVAAAAMLQGMTAHYLVNATYPSGRAPWRSSTPPPAASASCSCRWSRPRAGGSSPPPAPPTSSTSPARSGAHAVIDYRDRATTSPPRCERPTGATGSTSPTTAWARRPSTRPSPRCGRAASWSSSVAPAARCRPSTSSGSTPLGSLFLTRPTLGSYVATREELLERGTSVLGDLAAGRLRLEVGGRYPLEEAATAYDDLEARRTTGKLLLVP